MPISCTRSFTDIIITLKMLTAATTREMLPIAIMKVVMVPRVDEMLEIRELASWIRITCVRRLTLSSIAASVWLMLSMFCMITLT